MATSRLALLLAALAMLGPFAIDTYLPAFPSMEASLGASTIEVQQTLTVYMVAFAAMTLWHGAFADVFGRRNVILAWLAVFAVASLGCAAANSVQYLWAFRVLQGISAGAGVVVGRAMIRDLHSGPQAERLLSLVTMIFSIAPALAPVLGGWIVRLADWRSIFLFIFGYSALLLWVCWKHLPETLPVARRQALDARALARSYVRVFRSPVFQLNAGTIAFVFSGLFLYVAAAPVFLIRHLGLGTHQFGWQFVPTVAGIFLGALTANRLAGRLSVPRQVRLGLAVLVLAALANVAYHVMMPPTPSWSIAPLFFYAFGMAVTMPGVTLLVLDLFAEIRGIVASSQSFTMTMLGALAAGVAAPALSGSVLALALGQLACAVAALVCWRLGRWQTRVLAADARRNAWETVP